MPDSPPIVLLHGFSNTGACWRRVLAEGVQADTPTLRGHTLVEVLDELASPGPITLGGYSQGGRIALHAALDPRFDVRRLVLIGASPGIAEETEREARRRADEELAAWIEGHTIERFADRWEQTPVLGGLSPELAAEARADRLHNTPQHLAATLRGLGTGALPPLWGRLGGLRMPVTLIAGERDEKFTAIAHEMAARIRDAEVLIVPRAGHQVHLERPDAVTAALR